MENPFNMTTLLTLLIPFISALVGGFGGFFLRALIMQVNFKQRTIDNKIKVYDSIIVHWVKTRNFIYSQLPNDPHEDMQFDTMYGESQAFIGEAILVSEDPELTESINTFNERLYRTTDWANIPHEEANKIMENIKKDAIPLVSRMREDIKDSTRFEIKDFFHIVGGFRKKNVAKT